MNTTLGDLCARLYEAALEEYGDPEMAAMVAATVLNEVRVEAGGRSVQEEAA